jgi:hypothetical protein
MIMAGKPASEVELIGVAPLNGRPSAFECAALTEESSRPVKLKCARRNSGDGIRVFSGIIKDQRAAGRNARSFFQTVKGRDPNCGSMLLVGKSASHLAKAHSWADAKPFFVRVGCTFLLRLCAEYARV